MAVSGGMLVSLCFLDSLVRRPLRLMSFLGFWESFEASWSSMSTFAMSAQHLKNRSFSGGRLASFFLLGLLTVAVTVAVIVAMGVVAIARTNDCKKTEQIPCR
ncbi:hypothetical protein RRF57_008505 [Xylaria bambusicola]|uniref:Uncharacterized protein n=1 Tax=Xylaria bambusicola TaxID=326684 RepID=A0AAN7UU14_9PEZI